MAARNSGEEAGIAKRAAGGARKVIQLGAFFALTASMSACSIIESEDLTSQEAHVYIQSGQGANAITSEAVTSRQLAQQDDSLDDLYGYDAEDNGDDLDPFETFNRFMFAINETLDTFILRPVAVTYKTWAPEVVQSMVGNAVRNLTSPLTLVNDVAQGNLDRAETTASRLVINTVLSLGLGDPATDMGYPYHEEDFGQTMASYGAGPGAYVVLPLFGPSTARDTIGLGVDYLTDPVRYIGIALDAEWITYARAGGRAVNFRAKTLDASDELYRDALDPYTRVRSFYLQARESKIQNRDHQDNPLVAGENPSLVESLALNPDATDAASPIAATSQ